MAELNLTQLLLLSEYQDLRDPESLRFEEGESGRASDLSRSLDRRRSSSSGSSSLRGMKEKKRESAHIDDLKIA